MGTNKATLEQMDEELEQVLTQTAAQSKVGYGEALALLKSVADRLAKFLNGPGRTEATVGLELGHAVSQGQEYRMVIHASSIGLKDYLLRAYVPSLGFPVVLDYLSEEPRRYDTQENLSAALVEMIKHPQMMARLLAIQQVLSDETLRGERREVVSFRGGNAAAASHAKSSKKGTAASGSANAAHAARAAAKKSPAKNAAKKKAK
jgi:hypothetical protein